MRNVVFRTAWLAGRGCRAKLVRLGFLLAFAVLIVGAGPVRAGNAPPLVLDAQTVSASLAGHLDLRVDPDHSLAIGDVAGVDADRSFHPLSGFFGAGHTLDVHWYRFDLLRPANAPETWVLAMGSPYLDHVDVFVPDPDAPDGPAFRTLRTGDHVPFAERPLRTRLLAVNLTLPADTPVTVYVRIESVSAMTFTATLWRPDAFLEDTTRSLFLHGMFQGLLAIVIMLYAFLGLMLGDSALIGYALYAVTLFVYYACANGLAAMLLPDAPGWALNLMTGGSGLAGVAAAVFMWDRLLNLRVTYPRVHRVFMAISLLALASVPSAAMPFYGLVNRPVVAAGMLVTVVSLGLLCLLIRRNRQDVSLRYYVAAFLPALLGLLTAQLALRGVLPMTGLAENGYQIASVVHVIILGFGLSHRVRDLQRDKVRADQEIRFAQMHAKEQRNFVAMLSHEFRSPLASIDSAAQLIELREENLSSPSRDRLARIRSVAHRLCDLVDLFLSSDALDQGALALNPERVPLGPFLDGVREQVTLDHAPAATIALSVAPEDGILEIDPQFMAIAVGNLVRNALRYSPEGAPVAIDAATGPSGSTITVTDRGYGMSPEEVERIGAMYFRAKSSEGTQGVGIGLYITRKIIAAHGGTLDVSSNVGEGTRFVIRLPR